MNIIISNDDLMRMEINKPCQNKEYNGSGEDSAIQMRKYWDKSKMLKKYLGQIS